MFAQSKTLNKNTERLKIKSEINNEQVLITFRFVFGSNAINIAPAAGKIKRYNNIAKKPNNGFEPLFSDYKTNTLTD